MFQTGKAKLGTAAYLPETKRTAVLKDRFNGCAKCSSFVRFEVTGALLLRTSLSQNVTPCCFGEWLRSLQGLCRFHLQVLSSTRTLFSLLLFRSGCFISCSNPKTLWNLEFLPWPYVANALRSGDVARERRRKYSSCPSRKAAGLFEIHQNTCKICFRTMLGMFTRST